MLLGLALPAGALPWDVLVANVLGALLLGVVTARVPAEEMRLLFGTGVLGGFTTYSALAVGTVELWTSAPLLAVSYAVGSVALGLAAAAAGLRLGGGAGQGRAGDAP
ncbi:CrcB family protein [Microbacterium sp. EF45047]|nr:CrcB family protein [Microbacterium neungamense]WCM56746.1 CrcB family protein [Microbacterium sp. EF45047]